MKTTETKSLAEIAHHAIQTLCREIGVANTIRFINQFTMGFGNYAEERRAMFDNLAMEEYEAELEKIRAKQNPLTE